MTKRQKAIWITSQLLFWGWNAFAILLIFLSFNHAVLPLAIMAGFNGEYPVSILICLLILVSMPFIAVYFGVKRPKQLALFFSVFKHPCLF